MQTSTKLPTKTIDDIKMPINMSIEEILIVREQLVSKKEELEAGISVLGGELLERLKKEKVNGMVVSNYSISKVNRVSFTTSVSEAKELGATTETIDTKMLKILFNKGVDVPGVKISEYVSVREIKEKDASA